MIITVEEAKSGFIPLFFFIPLSMILRRRLINFRNEENNFKSKMGNVIEGSSNEKREGWNESISSIFLKIKNIREYRWRTFHCLFMLFLFTTPWFSESSLSLSNKHFEDWFSKARIFSPHLTLKPPHDFKFTRWIFGNSAPFVSLEKILENNSLWDYCKYNSVVVPYWLILSTSRFIILTRNVRFY